MFRPYESFMNVAEKKLRELRYESGWEPAIGYYRKIFGKDMSLSDPHDSNFV